jgi:cytochrome P450
MVAGSGLVDDDNLMVPERFTGGHPHVDWKKLRDTAPVYYCQPNGYRPYWAITKYRDIVEIEKRSEVFLNEPRFRILPASFEDYLIRKFGSVNGLFKMMAQMDAPEHIRYRNLLLPWFTAKSLSQREGEIRAICERFFDDLALKGESGEIDLAQDLAYWFPLRVVCALLGLPPEEDPIVLKLSHELFSFGTAQPGTGELSGYERLVNYFKAVAEDRRLNPKEDLSTYLVQARLGGEPLQDRELLAYFVIMATAGHDTTSSAITGGVKALIEHPDQLQMLRNDPSKLGGAVEEILRWVTPTIHFSRTAACDYELRGQVIRKGETVVLYYSSANRDDEVFPDPDVFDITRSPNRHLAFGSGPHACLGMQLARMEIRCFLRVLLERVEHLQISGPTPSIAASLVTRLAHLPVRYRVRPSAAHTRASVS